MVIRTVLDDKQTVRKNIQSVTLTGLSVTVFMSGSQSQENVQPTGLKVKQTSRKQWKEGPGEVEETKDRGDKRPRTDTDTDPECTQSRQKKRQMEPIFLSDSDGEAIVDFVKQHEELFDSCEVQRQAQEKGTLGNSCSFQEFSCQYC